MNSFTTLNQNVCGKYQCLPDVSVNVFQVNNGHNDATEKPAKTLYTLVRQLKYNHELPATFNIKTMT